MTATSAVTATADRSRVDRLRSAAAQASQVRALSTHPDVVALRVESVRTQVDRCMWVGIVLGLAFTMVNVQAFAAQQAAVWSLPWLAAWLLDPMVSLVLIAVLRAEQITARYQVSDHTRWIGRTKRFAFAATYAMNTWASFVALDVAGIVLHSVPPLLVFCAAETAPVLRDRLTEAVLRAEHAAIVAAPELAAGASQNLATATPAAEMPPGSQPTETARDTATAAAGRSSTTRASRPRRKASKPSKPGRKLLADFVADAMAAVEPGMSPDAVTAAWARRVTDCSTGLSPKVAAAVRAALANSNDGRSTADTGTNTSTNTSTETTTDAEAGALDRPAAA